MPTFSELKSRGVLSTELVAGELKVTKKQFSPETGEEIEEKIDIYLKPTLEANKLRLESELAEVVEMLEEFED